MKISFKTVDKLAIFTVIAFFLFVAYIATAEAEGVIIDPTIKTQMIITCEYPIEREDGTPLAINEIATINFYVSPSIASPNWQLADSDSGPACKQVYDLSIITDGQYYYTAQTVDTEARESILAADAIPPEYWAVVVKRIANPAYPTGFTATFN